MKLRLDADRISQMVRLGLASEGLRVADAPVVLHARGGTVSTHSMHVL